MMDSKIKKKITPHKGGRTKRIECRVSPEIKSDLQKIAEKLGVTIADLIEKWVKESNEITR